MNTKYGKLVDGKLVYAPKALETDEGIKVNPSKASYLAAGWKKIVDVRPVVDAGSHLEISTWKEDAETLTCVYKAVPGVAPGDCTRVFSKLKAVMALKKAGLWVLTKTWIEENGRYDLYLAAQDFSEDNEFFQRGLAEIKALARKSDAEVEAILAACVAD